MPVPGYQVQILDDGGNQVTDGSEGNIVIKLPLPPGTLAGLWRDDDRYRSSYLSAFDGYYLTGDSGFIDAGGYVFVPAAPTTSSTSPDTGSPPAASKRWWPRIRPSPNALSSAFTTTSKVSGPAVTWCSNRVSTSNPTPCVRNW